ncbi:MAG: hypothetical protein R2710_08385 [Acidimicrobiales bacterium]
MEQVADVEAVRPAVLATARLGGIDADLLLTDMASCPIFCAAAMEVHSAD